MFCENNIAQSVDEVKLLLQNYLSRIVYIKSFWGIRDLIKLSGL